MNELVDILYEMGIDSAAIGALSAVLGVMIALLSIGAIISLVLYIFQAVGLYSIAKRRNLSGAWLSWIPVGQYWVAGSIADQYQNNVKGSKTAYRIISLILGLASLVISAILTGISVSMMIQLINAAVNNDMQQLSYFATVFSGSSSLMSLVNSGLAIASYVFWQISLYNVYASGCPKNAVAFLILGIIFPVTIPFFLLCNRKKDEGMVIPQPVAPVYDDYQY